MKLNRSTLLSLGLPLLLLAAYVSLIVVPRSAGDQPAQQMTAADSGTLWNQCKSLFDQAKYQQALADALKLHTAYPANHLYLEMAAESYGKLDDPQHEAEYWEQYMDSAPNPITACPQIGQAYWKQGRTGKAIAAYRRCLAIDPDNTDSIFFLAHALERAGQRDRAAELYRRGLKLAPGYSDMQLGLARIWLRQGKPLQAEEASKSVLRRSPDDLDALLVAGLACFSQGKLGEAKTYLSRGSALAGRDADFHEALARIAERENNVPEALRQYGAILEQHPDDQRIAAQQRALRQRAR